MESPPKLTSVPASAELTVKAISWVVLRPAAALAPSTSSSVLRIAVTLRCGKAAPMPVPPITSTTAHSSTRPPVACEVCSSP